MDSWIVFFNSKLLMRSVINLVKTNNGYSLIEGDSLLNKSASTKPIKDKAFANQKKLVQNFTIYPYIPTRPKQPNPNPANGTNYDRNQGVQGNQGSQANQASHSLVNSHENKQHVENAHRFFIIPARSQWFSINSVHEIEKKALPEWFKQKKVPFGTVKGDKFEKNQELYKKYRNHIIELGKEQYVSAYKARVGLAGDVCSIIRIHDFLEKWGLINYVFSKKQPEERKIDQQRQESKPKNRNVNRVVKKNMFHTNVNTEKGSVRKDCLDKQKHLATTSKNFNKEDLELLKKVTKQVRPVCHYCQGICGVVWFQYKENLVLKKFTPYQSSNLSSQGGIQSASQPFQYTLRLCSFCYFQGNLPFVLSMNNFQRKSIISAIEKDSQLVLGNFSKIAGQIYQNANKSLHSQSHAESSAKETTKRTRSSTHYQNGGLGNHSKENLEENQTVKAIQSIVDLLERNKLSFKKTVQDIQVKSFNQNELLKVLFHFAAKKLDKLKNIQFDSEQNLDALQQPVTKQTKENQSRFADFMQEDDQTISRDQNQISKKDEKSEIIGGILTSQKQAYQQFIQLWIVKMGIKLEKLNSWDQTVNWTELHNKNLQKQAIAESLKTIKFDCEQSSVKQ